MPAPDHRLRVALDATALLGERAGVAAFCLGALEGLARRPDLAVSAFCVSWRRRGLLAPSLPAGVGHEQRAMPARPLHEMWRRFSYPPLEWFTSPVDVVHGTNFVVPPTRRAGRVVTVHDLTVLRFPELCAARTLVFGPMVRRAIAEGAWVHTPSRFVADEVVAELGADPARVRTVHHGIPSHVLWPGDAPATGNEPAVVLPAGTTRYVLAVGTIEPRKDLPGLVRAFDDVAARHDDVALVLAGGDGWGTSALEAALAATRSAARVVRTGWIDDARLRVLLAGAAVLAYPSVYEGFGFPPLEAMAAGVPVVATAVGAIPEVVGDAATLVPPGDRDALAGALSRILDDGAWRDELVERGARQAAMFSWEACAAGLADLYADVRASSLSSPSSSPSSSSP